MVAIRKIDIAVAEDIATEIDAVVASGEFATVDAVVGAALEAWKVNRVLADPDNALRLRRLWTDGLASGTAIEGNFDLADIKRRAALRHDSALG